MKLTDVGEARIRGYLFVLDRSLRSFLPRETAGDAVREIESHIRERVASAPEPGARIGEPAGGQARGSRSVNGAPDEREAIERVLAELGPPLRVAQAYSHEMTLDEAVTTGRFVPMARAVWHAAASSVFGFVWLLIAFVGWTLGIGVTLVGLIKIVFPNNVGAFYVNGQFHSAGANFGLPPGTVVHPFGYWIVPVSIALGLGILVLTQRASRRILAWMRSRRPPARLRLKVEIEERS
jgi:uncharacterized membrane protein